MPRPTAWSRRSRRGCARLGLQTDAIVGIQLANTVESVLTILGVLRAGLIAMPLPLLWRRADMRRARSVGSAPALIVTNSRSATSMPAPWRCRSPRTSFRSATSAASAEICRTAWSRCDGLLQDAAPELPPSIERDDNPAAHVAVMTFDITPDGLIAVARNHAELIAGGLASLLEGRIEPDARLLGCCATGSFAGLALTMMPWLLSRGTLLLHHGFDASAFAAQCREHCPDTVVVPGALVPQLAEAGLLAHAALKNVLAAWRAPERCLASPAWRHSSAGLTDIHIFGEIGLLGLRRSADGAAVPLPLHAVVAPSGSANAVPVADIARSASGTLSLRGPMVPRHPFPPGASPQLKADPEAFVDTFYPCRLDRISGTVTVTGPPGRRQRRLLSLRAPRTGGSDAARGRRCLCHRVAGCACRTPPRRRFGQRRRYPHDPRRARNQSAHCRRVWCGLTAEVRAVDGALMADS